MSTAGADGCICAYGLMSAAFKEKASLLTSGWRRSKQVRGQLGQERVLTLYFPSFRPCPLVASLLGPSVCPEKSTLIWGKCTVRKKH